MVDLNEAFPLGANAPKEKVREYLSGLAALEAVPETTADLPDATDRRYVTEYEKAVIAAGGANVGYAYNTKASLDLNTSAEIGARAEVVNDSDMTLRGVYQRQISGWVKISPLPYTALARAIDGIFAPAAFNHPVIIDKSGIYGGGPAVYVPAKVYWGTSQAVRLSKTYTAADTKVIGYLKAALADTTSLQVVLIDTQNDAEPLVVVTYPDLPETASGRYLFVASLFGNDGTNVASEYVSTRDDGASIAMAFFPPVLDPTDNRLYFANLTGRIGSGVGSVFQVLSTDAATSFFREVDVPFSPVKDILIDPYAALASSTAAESVILRDAAVATTARAGRGMALLGSAYQGQFRSAVGAAALVRNAISRGREDNDLCRPYGSSAPVDLSAEAIALGFARGWENGSTNAPFAEIDIPEAPTSGSYFLRWYIEATNADQFGNPGAYLVATDGTSPSITRRTEKQISANIRMCCAFGRLPAGKTLSYVRLGTFGTAGNPVRVFGFQAGFAPADYCFVSRQDYPRFGAAAVDKIVMLGMSSGSYDPAFSGTLGLVEGRGGLTIYPDQMHLINARRRYRATFASLPASGPPLAIEAQGGSVPITPERLGSTLDIRLWDHAADATKPAAFSVTVLRKTAAQAAAASPNILVIGDSLCASAGVTTQTKQRLIAMGATPTFVGTVTAKEDESAITALGESRGGREFADFIGEDIADSAPIAVGDESAYLALSSDARWAYNPFLRAATGSDPTERVFNGHIFDMAFYLSRFSIATPDVVVVALGRNDISAQVDAESLAQIQRGLAVIVGQTRAALPTARIILPCHPLGRFANEVRVETEERAGIKAHLEYVRTLGDPNVHVLPLWAMVSRDAGFRYSSAAPDAIGRAGLTLSDGIHYGSYGAAQAGEALAQMIVASL